jgi:hypothetical protein
MNKIQDLFNDNPILAKIGTPKQYAEYLNTIFPNSKVKKILYHGAMEQLLPKDNFKGYITYFTDIKNYAETFGFPINRKVISAVIDVKSPYRAPSELADVPDNIHNSDEFTNPRIIKSQNKGFDSVIGKDAGQKEGNTVAVFEPEQIHILGSKEDIEKFKKYTEKNIKENMSSFKIFSKEWWKESLGLHESPPNNFENDDNHQYVEDNLSAINKIALVFNFPVEDLQLAFNGASNLVLSDDVWSKLENSNSYNIQTLGQALLYAKENKIDAVPYLKAIKNLESLPKALILNYDNDKYYLVNGEFVLSLQKALNLTPDTLMARINPKIHEDSESKEEVNLINEFINYVKNELGLVQTPKIDFSDDIDHVKEQRSFGYFSPDTNIIWVYTGDRNMADIFRTLAHELVHRKQEEDGKINYESGETGSDIENEANAKAGVLLRDFGKKHDGIYDTSIKKFIKTDLNEVKIEKPLNLNFSNTKTVVGKSKVATNLFEAGYFMELLDLGSYYTFIPGAEPPAIFLIPKEYIDTPEDIQRLAHYSEPLPNSIMDIIKQSIQDNKIEIVKQSTNLNEVKIQLPKRDYSSFTQFKQDLKTEILKEFPITDQFKNEYPEYEHEYGNISNYNDVYTTKNGKVRRLKLGFPKFIHFVYGPDIKDKIYEVYKRIAQRYNYEFKSDDNFTIYFKNINEVIKVQNPAVDLDQKIKDISNDINDQIEHIYFIGYD